MEKNDISASRVSGFIPFRNVTHDAKVSLHPTGSVLMGWGGMGDGGSFPVYFVTG